MYLTGAVPALLRVLAFAEYYVDYVDYVHGTGFPKPGAFLDTQEHGRLCAMTPKHVNSSLTWSSAGLYRSSRL